MAQSACLQRRRTGYYFRQRVPKQYIDIIGRREIAVSLRTSDYLEAKFRCRYVESILLVCYKGGSSGSEVKSILNKLQFPQAKNDLTSCNITEHGNFSLDKTVNLCYNTHFENRGSTNASALEYEGQILDTISSSHKPINLSPSEAGRHAMSNSQTITVTDALTIWKNEKRPKPRTYTEYKRAIEHFVDTCGDLTVDTIQVEHIRQWRTAVVAMCNAPSTAKKILGALKAVLNSAVEHQYITLNPASGISTGINRDPVVKRLPLDARDLRKLFNWSLYKGSEKAPRIYGTKLFKEAIYWGFLIALYTGMRQKEILQLAVNDIYEQNGVWLINIHGSTRGNSVKTDSSIRIVPIHSELIRIGFLKYLDQKIRSGATKLFECSETRFSPAVNRYLKQLGIKKDSSKCFHSLRHTFVTECRNVIDSDEIRYRITGHSDTRIPVGYSYGTSHSVEIMKREIEKLRYDVDLSFMHRVDVPTQEDQSVVQTPAILTTWIPLSSSYMKFGKAVYGDNFGIDEIKLIAHDTKKIPRGKVLYLDSHRDDLLQNHPLFLEDAPPCELNEASQQACEQAAELRYQLLKAMPVIKHKVINAATGEEEPNTKIKWLMDSPNVKIYFTDSMVDMIDDEGNRNSYKILLDGADFETWLRSNGGSLAS